MVWSAPIMANNLKNKVTLKVRLFRRLSEVLLRRFVASPVKSVMPSTSSLCKCRIIILNNHKYSSFFYEYVRLSLYTYSIYNFSEKTIQTYSNSSTTWCCSLVIPNSSIDFLSEISCSFLDIFYQRFQISSISYLVGV